MFILSLFSSINSIPTDPIYLNQSTASTMQLSIIISGILVGFLLVNFIICLILSIILAKEKLLTVFEKFLRKWFIFLSFVLIGLFFTLCVIFENSNSNNAVNVSIDNIEIRYVDSLLLDITKQINDLTISLNHGRSQLDILYNTINSYNKYMNYISYSECLRDVQNALLTFEILSQNIKNKIDTLTKMYKDITTFTISDFSIIKKTADAINLTLGNKIKLMSYYNDLYGRYIQALKDIESNKSMIDGYKTINPNLFTGYINSVTTTMCNRSILGPKKDVLQSIESYPFSINFTKNPMSINNTKTYQDIVPQSFNILPIDNNISKLIGKNDPSINGLQIKFDDITMLFFSQYSLIYIIFFVKGVPVMIISCGTQEFIFIDSNLKIDDANSISSDNSAIIVVDYMNLITYKYIQTINIEPAVGNIDHSTIIVSPNTYPTTKGFLLKDTEPLLKIPTKFSTNLLTGSISFTNGILKFLLNNLNNLGLTISIGEKNVNITNTSTTNNFNYTIIPDGNNISY